MVFKQKTLVRLIFFLSVTSYFTYKITLSKNYFEKISFKFESFNFSNSTTLPNKKSIFCLLLTSKKNFLTKSKTLYDTWAKNCDNLKFLSLLPDELLRNSSNDLVLEKWYTENWLQPPGLIEDRYDKLTSKIYLSLKHVYKTYPDYDWYLKADDDTFIFIDNLRKFLSDKIPSNPVTYGYDFKVIVNNGYHSGGASYLLSKEAFNRIGSKLNENFDFCPNSGTEDVDVAKCLRILGVNPEPSIDDHGRERFHPLSLNDHFSGNFPEWLKQYAKNPLKKVLNFRSILFSILNLNLRELIVVVITQFHFTI